MGFDIGDKLKLSDNKDYLISLMKNIDGKWYFLLLEHPELNSFKYVELVDSETLTEINDLETLEWLSKEFLELKN